MAVAFVAAVQSTRTTSVASSTWTLAVTGTVASGELLVLKTGTGSQNVTATSISDGQSNTWTRQVQVPVTASNAHANIWTATASASGSLTVTVTFTNAGTSTVVPQVITLERYTGAGIGTGTNTATGSTTGQGSITTAAANSAVVWVSADFNGVTGTTTYVASNTQTFAPYQQSGAVSVYEAFRATTTAGAYAYGTTAPATSVKFVLAALELAATPISAAVSLSGTGTLSAAGTLIAAASATLASTSSLSVTGNLTAVVTDTLASTSALTANAVIPAVGAATLASTSALTANADPPLAPAQATLAAVSGLSAGSGQLAGLAYASLAAGSALYATAESAGAIFKAPPGPVVPQVRFPHWRLLVFDTVTGRVGYELPWTSLSWTSKLNDAGTMTATLPVESAFSAIGDQLGADDPRTLLREFLTGPYRYSLAVLYGNDIVWAGPYLPSSAAPDKPTVDIAGVEFMKLFDKRLMLNPAGAGAITDPSYDIAVSAATLRWITYQAVSLALTGTNRSLPVTCSNIPAQDGLLERRWNGYDLTTVYKALQDLSNESGGPDIRFDPYLTVGSDGQYVHYELRIGDPFVASSGPLGPDAPLPWTWDESVALITPNVDATGLATSYFVNGAGQDRAKLIGTASSSALTTLGWPALEAVDGQHTSSGDQVQLDSFAAADIAASTAPLVAWAVKVPADYSPPAGSFRVGDLARFDVDRNLYLASGSYERRITQLSGDGGNFVSMTVVEESG